ncbi:small ribosomal subunit protein mS25-like isoform X3 [Acropora palmata]|uniref:small ribosomal subunit protein mS25-like isoform X3 n=1 Tax=Acropora palmata TaxID=6131 RepID=UPI003D9FC69F
MPSGRFPFRRTYEFLSAGNLVLKSSVKTVLLNYTHRKNSLGLRNFIFKDVPQIQFKNRTVQIMTLRNQSDIPLINVFLGDGRKITIDVESKTGPEILGIFGKVAGATELERKDRAMPKYPGRFNPANFAWDLGMSPA